MFLENQNKKARSGWIEVIVGSMFSGKTEELIRRLKRAQIAKQKTVIYKAAVDTRYDNEKVISHDDNAILSIPAASSIEIWDKTTDEEVIGIDEAQFFDDNLPKVCFNLANLGKRVIIAGLDMDFKGRPFGPIPTLMAQAEYVTKVHAICMRCGALAQFSHRISDGDDLVVLGETDKYEPLCRSCFVQAEGT
ncbi:MAG: thymidine kinase [Bacteroidota bacterium]